MGEGESGKRAWAFGGDEAVAKRRIRKRQEKREARGISEWRARRSFGALMDREEQVERFKDSAARIRVSVFAFVIIKSKIHVKTRNIVRREIDRRWVR